MTELPAVKEMIEGQLGHLKSELNNQGLSLDKFDVSLLTSDDARQFDDHQRQAQEFNGRKQRRRQMPPGADRTEGDAGAPPAAGPLPAGDGLSVMA